MKMIHGTQAGYQRHLRGKDPVCDDCREANRIYQREYQRNRAGWRPSTIACDRCGDQFKQTKPHQRFCSYRCRTGNSPWRTYEERFWGRVEKSFDKGGCWTWAGRVDRYGYGVCDRSDGRSAKAHRVAWELTSTESIEDKHLHHSCGNTACVRPDHLIPLDPAEHRAIHKKAS